MIRLTREVRFSVDRDWAGRLDPARPVTNSWAGWPSAVGLAPYLRLRITVAGEPDERTGYLTNIKTLDELARRDVIPFVAERMQAEGWRTAPERLVLAIWERVVGGRPAHTTLEEVVLLATPYLSYVVGREEPTMVRVTQQFEFSAAHRLHCPELSDAENQAVFGKCNNPSGHGHNYVVEVTLSGTPDATHGSVLALPRFEEIVHERVITRLDHKHLNQDTAEFQALNPTVENIARVIWEMLDGAVTPASLSSIRVYETPKTWADYAGA